MDPASEFVGRQLPPDESRLLPGGNNPPEATPYEAARDRIEDLWGEAIQWLDGDEIINQGTADMLDKMLDMIRDARKEADTARKAEAKPFDDGKAEVQARYNPLLKKADTAADAIKKALTPWRNKIAAEKAAEAEAARKEAEAKRLAAEEAIRASQTNLLEREAAEAELKAAKKAEAVARKIDKAPTGLRTTYKPVMTDAVEAARHYWKADRAEMERFIMTLAARDVANGKRAIPGFDVQVIKTAV